MKDLLLIPSLILAFIACSGEKLSDTLDKKNIIEQTRDKYPIEHPKTFQKITLPTQLRYYYQSIDFNKNGEALKEDLAVLTISKHIRILSYNERHPHLEKANADTQKTGNVILVYTGESRAKTNVQKRNNTNGDINTEHIYPQSHLRKLSDNYIPIGDLHHLHYIDRGVNSSRGNLPFTEGKGEAERALKGKAWYPSDEFKGDVARMLMYMYLRYNLPWHNVTTEGLGLLLKWNAEDKVSSLELQRNNIIEEAQGNRNPFIDNPYLATKIFGEVKGYPAQNTWK